MGIQQRRTFCSCLSERSASRIRRNPALCSRLISSKASYPENRKYAEASSGRYCYDCAEAMLRLMRLLVSPPNGLSAEDGVTLASVGSPEHRL
jgi:hypothetical protein